MQQENLGQKFIDTVPNSRHKLTAHVWRHKFSPVPIRSQIKKFQISAAAKAYFVLCYRFRGARYTAAQLR